MEQAQLVLVTGHRIYRRSAGASALGGRLSVRCLVRDARRLQGRPWSEQVEVVEGDATRPEPCLVPWQAYGRLLLHP